MADPFVAEIRIFTGNFAPKGWAFCDGQLLPLMQNTALFSLLGTNYGGNGTTTFALPDLRGRMPLGASHSGGAGGLSPRPLGESAGDETVALIEAEIPSHRHDARALAADGTLNTPAADRLWARPRHGRAALDSYAATRDTALHPSAIAPAGGGQGHDNLHPYLTVNFIIALQGVFPPRP